LHVLVAWGIINGLGTRIVSKVTEAVETKTDRRSETAATAGNSAAAAAAGNEGPTASVHPAGRGAGAATATAAKYDRRATNTPPPTTSLAPPAPPSPAPAAKAPAGPSRTDAVADFNTCARPEYPKSSLRNEETGTTTLQFLIGVNGNVMDSKCRSRVASATWTEPRKRL
jgi:protein TonB